MRTKSEIQSEKIERLAKLEKIISDSPLTRKIQEENEKESLRKRRGAVKKIEELEEERAVLLDTRYEIQGREALLQAKKDELKKYEIEVRQKEFEFMSESLSFDVQINKLKNQLADTCDPQIQKDIEFFERQLSELRKPGAIHYQNRGAERNIFTEKKQLRQETNEQAVLDALKYCQNAIKQINEMKFDAEYDSNKVEEMKKGIPDFREYSESEIELNLEKGPEQAFLARQLHNLHEKAARLLAS